MIEQQELVSWLAFPDVAQWHPFHPTLECEVRTSERRIETRDTKSFETDSLAEAVALLGRDRFHPVLYRALSQRAVVADSWQREVRFELDWSVSDPSGARPRGIRKRSRSRLWSKAKQRVGYFALTNSLRDSTIHLVVGGASSEECIEIWAKVSRWVRRLYQLSSPRIRMPVDVAIPQRPRAEIQREARRHRECIRKAVLESAEAEKGPYHLKGRGHEARVSLSVRLAAILRGLDLPSANVSGYGANNFYPHRVMDRAAKMLQRRLGQPVLRCNGYQMYLVD